MKTILFLLIIAVFHLSAQDTLSLSQAIQEGLKHNYGIQVAGLNKKITENNNNWSGALPTFGVSGTQTNNITNSVQTPFVGPVREGKNLKSNTLAGSAMLNWTIFDGMYMFVTKDKLSLLEQQSENQLRMSVEATTASIIVQYHEILLQTEVLKTLDTTISISKQRLSLAQQRERIGSGSFLETSKAEADLNTDSSAYLTQLFLIANSKTEINKLIGRPLDKTFEVKKEDATTPLLKLETLKSGMLSQNKELLMARQSEVIAQKTIRQEQSNRYPQLSLFAGYNYSKSTFAIGFAQYTRSYGPTYGASLSWNIFNGTQTQRAVQNARVQQEITTLAAIETEQQLEKQLIQSYASYNMYQNIQALERKNLSIVQQNIDIALRKYSSGSMSDLELREIQATYLDGVIRLYNADYKVKQYETDLLLLAGQLGTLTQN